VVPTPDDVRKLIDAAEQSKRPEYARAILVAATTGIRRAELCAVRRRRDVDWERGLLSITASIVVLKDVPLQEIPTKNRRGRTIALDDLTMSMLRAQVEMLERRAAMARVELAPDAYVFSDDIEGVVPWKPDAVSQYFGRLRRRAGRSRTSAFTTCASSWRPTGRRWATRCRRWRCEQDTIRRLPRGTTAVASRRPTVTWRTPSPHSSHRNRDGGYASGYDATVKLSSRAAKCTCHWSKNPGDRGAP